MGITFQLLTIACCMVSSRGALQLSEQVLSFFFALSLSLASPRVSHFCPMHQIAVKPGDLIGLRGQAPS